MLKKPGLPSSTEDVGGYYEKWCSDSIAKAKEILSQNKPHPDHIYGVALDFSRLIMPPKEQREIVWTAIRNSNQLEEVERIRRIFEEYKKNLSPGIMKNLMDWLTFPPFTPELPSQAVTSLPISLAEQHFYLEENDYKTRLDASWNGLQTCICPRKSPQGVDSFMQTIADDLKGNQQAVIIDFGSGDCLPLIPLISRLTYLNKIHLHLIDHNYDRSLVGEYHISKNFISNANANVFPKPVGEENCSVQQFFRICSEFLQTDQHLYVTVHASSQMALEKLSASKGIKQLQHVLYTVDPIPSIPFYRDFTLLRDFLIEKTKDTFFYCLNEARVSEYITMRVPAEVILKLSHLFK